MTDRQFIERMIELVEKMSDIYNSEPFDQQARLAILDEVHETGARFNRGRRQRSWFAIASVCFILLLLAWVLYTILCEL